MRLKIEKLIYGGDGLARLPGDDQGRGKSVFIPFVLEGELVEASLVDEKPGFARARLDSIIETSPERTQPGCLYFQHCGGCQYQHTSYENQLRIKAAIIRETLRRTAKIELPCELQVHASPPWNYRNRTRLKVQTSPEFAIGYYRFHSHDFLPIEQCPISSPLINRAIEALRNTPSAGMSASVAEIELFANEKDDELLVEVYCAHGTPRSGAEATCQSLMGMLPEIKGAVALMQPRSGQTNDPKILGRSGTSFISYRVGPVTHRVSAGAFFQVNRFLIDELAEIVTSNTSGKLALDLYAGVGLFSAALTRSFAQVISVESSQTSHADLRHNAPPEVKAVRATTDQYLAQASGPRPDLVVADPPRGGLGEKVLRNLIKLNAPEIRYVSCDPSTLARDLRALLTAGYRIEQAHLLDLFPQTFHIESIFFLAR